MFTVRNTSSHKSDLNCGIWILQELEILKRPIGLSQIQVHVGARKLLPVEPSVVVKTGALESCSHRYLRRRCGNEIAQCERNNSKETKQNRDPKEQMRAPKPQHMRPRSPGCGNT